MLSTIRNIIVLLIALPIIMMIFLFLLFFLVVYYFIEQIGKQINITPLFENIFSYLFSVEKAKQMRDELLQIAILAGNINPNDEYDKWGMEQRVQRTNSILKKKLRNGELALVFVGSIVAILAGNLWNLLEVFIAVLLIFLSILVLLRLYLVDSLIYTKYDIEGASDEDLHAMYLWNTEIVNTRRVVLLALISPILHHKLAYDVGMDLIYHIYASDEKWKNNIS